MKKQPNNNFYDALYLSIFAVITFFTLNLLIEIGLFKMTKNYGTIHYSKGYFTLGGKVISHSIWSYLISGLAMFLVLWYYFRKLEQ
ncbi:MAG TPA: hypothetical protein VL022_05295 [Moheibacter sp.]|nr:hypothetical protein [Moheibacter sp.]